MEKFKEKTREIRFHSPKNNTVVVVHSDLEKKYAGILEKQEDVVSYESNVPLNQSEYNHVRQLGIRKSYLSTLWASNFLLHYADGRFGIRELVLAGDIMKQSVLQQLEFSRRYWEQQHAYDWKIVLMEA